MNATSQCSRVGCVYKIALYGSTTAVETCNENLIFLWLLKKFDYFFNQDCNILGMLGKKLAFLCFAEKIHRIGYSQKKLKIVFLNVFFWVITVKFKRLPE